MDVSPRPHRWTPGALVGGLRSNRYSAPVLSSSSGGGGGNNSFNNGSSDGDSKKSCNHCHLCGKRLLKLAKWRNYLTLPCRCRHVFCKQCITGRLQCRQRVLSTASFEVQWTFPCPASQQCGQELNVDWSRGRRYSKNLVARDLGISDDSWEDQEEEGGECGGTASCDDISAPPPHASPYYVTSCHHPTASSQFEVRKSVSFDL